MSFIRTVSEAEATGQLAALYRRLAYQDGRVDEAYKALSLNPAVLAADAALYEATMYGESALSRAERELLALTVSRVNGCQRCFRHHAARHAALTGSGEASEPPPGGLVAALGERQNALLSFAEKLTREPSAVSGADIGALRRAGLDDRAILDTCNIVAYFGYANRMTFGLGLSPEAGPRA
jgi:uncharacterized peroxidase-related enzyme